MSWLDVKWLFCRVFVSSDQSVENSSNYCSRVQTPAIQTEAEAIFAIDHCKRVICFNDIAIACQCHFCFVTFVSLIL